jgi:hypothetical protein
MRLGLEPGPQVGELESEAHHLAELADLGRSDPGLGQAPEAQEVGQVSGVALVVLHSAMPPVVAMRVGQVDAITHLLEEVGRPVPAISGLEDHVAADRCCAHLLGKAHGIVFHPDAVDLVALFVHPVDDRTPAVQVDADILLCHLGLPFREGFV